MKKLLLVLVTLLSLNAFAQVTTSKIQGTVSDEAGFLSGVNIIAKHTPSGTITGAVSQFNGDFTIPNLRVGGPYTVTFSYIGYKTVEYSDIYLQLGKTSNIEAVMQSESSDLEEVVIKYSRDNTFNNGRTGAETSVGKKEIATLPTISRSQADFTRMEPSASGGSFGGRNDQYNNFSLDGSIFNNPFGLDAATPGGQTDAQPVSLDAIEQIQVSTAPYDVTQSGFTGASVNAVTKSGTNTFKGSIYTYYRNQDFTGGKIKGESILVPELNHTQGGVSLGGPIVKDKLFFFANFEKEARTDAGSNWIANNGDGTTGINESRVLESDLIAIQTALNSIVIGQDEAGQDIMYDTGAYQGYTHDLGSDKGIFKLDWNINQKNRLALTYNFLKASKDKSAHPTAINRRGPDATTLQFENSGYTMNNNLNSFLAELNSTLSEGKTTNKMQIGYTHFDDYRTPFSFPAPVINIFKNGSPYVIAGHEPFSINNKLDQKVFQFTNNLNHYVGNHALTLGVSFEKFMFDNSFNLKGYGFDVFGGTSIDPFITDSATGAIDTAAFQQYLIDTYTGTFQSAYQTYLDRNALEDGTDGGWNMYEVNVGQMAFYFQDEWKVTDNFKVTVGIRADKPMYFDSSQKAQEFINTDNSEWYDANAQFFDPADGSSVVFDATKMPTNEFIISPRFGFNYDVKGDNTFQIRGGSGIFTGRLPFVWLGNQIGGIDRFFYQTVDSDYKFPKVWRNNVGVDYKFESGLVFSTDLSYTKDINATHVQDWGLNKPTGTLDGVDNRPIYTDADVAYMSEPLPFLKSHAYVLTNSDKGRVINASLKVHKTFENGLYTMLAYNFMDSKDVNSIEAEITGDAFAFNPALGNVNDDVLSYSKYGDMHRVIGVVSKRFEYGAGDKMYTSLSSFFEYAQGNRFSYTYGGDVNGDGSGVNDLIFIPTATQVNNMTFTGDATSQAAQATALENYIQQDDYLSGRRGDYAERYGAISPWRGKVDFKFIQGYKLKGAKSVEFSLDILNLGNLLNSNWGVLQQPANVQPIGVSVAGDVPTYSFSEDAIQETFVNNASLLSRWQVQGGLRLNF